MTLPTMSIRFSDIILRASGSPKTVIGRAADGKLVHISETFSGRHGLACPDCDAELIGKKGDVRAHHFAHYQLDECAGAGETALHRIAKELIARQGGFRLPKLTVLGEQCLPAEWVGIENIETEKWEDGFRPDLSADIARAGHTERLYIEVCVTHAVGALKRSKVAERNTMMVEINLSRIQRDLSVQDLSDILQGGQWTYWVHHPAEAGFLAEITTRRNEEAARRRRLYEARREVTAIPNYPDMTRYGPGLLGRLNGFEESARKRPPAMQSEELSARANLELDRWAAVGCSGLLAVPADDSPFEVSPRIWRVGAISHLSPWAQGSGTRTKATDEAIRSCFADMCDLGWIKKEFRGGSRQESHVTNALDHIIRYVCMPQSHVGARDLSGGKYPLDRWWFRHHLDENLRIHDRMRRIDADLAQRFNQRLLLGDKPIGDYDEGRLWFASLRAKPALMPGLATVLNAVEGSLDRVGDGADLLLEASTFNAINLHIQDASGARNDDFFDTMHQASTERLRKDREARIRQRVDHLSRLTTDLIAKIDSSPMVSGAVKKMLRVVFPAAEDIHEHLTRGLDMRRISSSIEQRIDARSRVIEGVCAISNEAIEASNLLGNPDNSAPLRNIMLKHVLSQFQDGLKEQMDISGLNAEIGEMHRMIRVLRLYAVRHEPSLETSTLILRVMISTPPYTRRSILHGLSDGSMENANIILNDLLKSHRVPAWVRPSLPTKFTAPN